MYNKLFFLTISILLFFQTSGVFAVTQITGNITAKHENSFKVDFQPHKTAAPDLNDKVEFYLTLDGEKIEAGTGKVTKTGVNFVWVQTDDTHPDLTMKALIHATGITKKKKTLVKNRLVPLHPCDELAGDPWDDKRIGPSVKFSAIEADRAISACEEAARKYPAADRFQFQLARALTAKGQYKNARFYYSLAAVAGNYAAAQYNLGVMYQHGHGDAKDITKALEWYFKAAEQKHKSAQFNLGWMYENGEGVLKNDINAVKWYRKSAEQDYDRAQYNLGTMYYYGLGVSKNRQQAIHWFKKASIQGHEDAKKFLDKLGE
jgi:tetratricopeptide (TPR) repeat protein